MNPFSRRGFIRMAGAGAAAFGVVGEAVSRSARGARRDIDLYSKQSDIIGEGPVWSTVEQTLYWIDIGGKKLFRKAPSDAQACCWMLPDYPGCLATCNEPGFVAIAMGNGVQRFNLESGAAELLYPAPPGRPGTRFNDGKSDSRGRFWAGTMQNNYGPNGESRAIERNDGALYRFDPDGSVHTIEENIGISNTLAWSPDQKRFYFGDSLSGKIHVYDFDVDSGAVSNKRVFFEAPGRGVPDGSAIDADGCLWNARWDGGVVLRITPAGKVDREIAFPVPRPTSCMFGGRNLDTLFVTSASDGLSREQLAQAPLSGSVFAIQGVAQGMPIPSIVCKSRESA